MGGSMNRVGSYRVGSLVELVLHFLLFFMLKFIRFIGSNTREKIDDGQ